MPRPNLSELDVFACVARHRSFKKASDERGVSASALSHTLRGMETRMGVRLLNRTTRSVTPTEAGERLLSRLEPALRDIGDALDDVNLARDTPSGTLRLNVPRPAAHLVLAPLFAAFRSACPDVRLEVVTDDGLVDIVASGFDAGIRFDESLHNDMVAMPLGPAPRLTVVGSPSYASRHGLPQKPEQLKDHACIGRRFPSGLVYAWEFAKGRKRAAMKVDGPLVLDDDALMIRAAVEGVGLAFVYEAMVIDLIANGSLVACLQDWCAPTTPFHLYYPGRRHVPAALRAFIEIGRTWQWHAPDGPVGRK